MPDPAPEQIVEAHWCVCGNADCRVRESARIAALEAALRKIRARFEESVPHGRAGLDVTIDLAAIDMIAKEALDA